VGVCLEWPPIFKFWTKLYRILGESAVVLDFGSFPFRFWYGFFKGQRGLHLRQTTTAILKTKNPQADSDSPFGFGAVTWGHGGYSVYDSDVVDFGGHGLLYIYLYSKGS